MRDAVHPRPTLVREKQSGLELERRDDEFGGQSQARQKA
jgi:hypothetical protein